VQRCGPRRARFLHRRAGPIERDRPHIFSVSLARAEANTDYSLPDSACEIDQLMDVVAEQKMPAVAMTDHGNLFGAVSFCNAAKARGIHPAE
jgi:hypothetical protein